MRLTGLFLMVVMLGSSSLYAEASSRPLVPWVFEGRLDHVDGALIPRLKSGWVLSGSFGLDAAAMRPDADAAALGQIRFAGGIEAAEATVDLYYQVKAAAVQGDGLVGFEWLPSEDAALGQISFFLPLRGDLEGTSWTFQWLQLMLRGDWTEGTPALLSTGLEWESGFFRFVFVDAGGATAEAWGSLTLFGPAGEAALKESAQWEAALADLGGVLVARDARIESLEEALSQARSKVGALQGMLDLMARQRMELEAENQRLEGLLRAQPEVERLRQAGELAERALLAEALAAAESRSSALEAEVEAMTAHAATLRLELDALAPKVADGPAPADVDLPRAILPSPKAAGEGIPDSSPPESDPGAIPLQPGPYWLEENQMSPRVLEREGSERPERRFGPSKFR